MDSIIGSALPYVRSGDEEEKALARVVTTDGIMLKYLSGTLSSLYTEGLYVMMPCHLFVT